MFLQHVFTAGQKGSGCDGLAKSGCRRCCERQDFIMTTALPLHGHVMPAMYWMGPRSSSFRNVLFVMIFSVCLRGQVVKIINMSFTEGRPGVWPVVNCSFLVQGVFRSCRWVFGMVKLAPHHHRVM